MPPPASIFICGLSELDRHVAGINPSHLLSLLTPSHMPETPTTIPAANHLKVACHDIVEPFPEAILPADEHITSIIDFALGWDGVAPMLVHCFAGVSRSSAAALIVAMARETQTADVLTKRLRAAAPHAHPNERMIALADRLLVRNGELITAVKKMGFGKLVDRAPLVELNLI